MQILRTGCRALRGPPITQTGRRQKRKTVPPLDPRKVDPGFTESQNASGRANQKHAAISKAWCARMPAKTVGAVNLDTSAGTQTGRRQIAKPLRRWIRARLTQGLRNRKNASGRANEKHAAISKAWCARKPAKTVGAVNPDTRARTQTGRRQNQGRMQTLRDAMRSSAPRAGHPDGTPTESKTACARTHEDSAFIAET
jgi:hypothetical protein